jgi:threonine synthase
LGTLTHILCLQCGHQMRADIHTTKCEKCNSPWVDARYNYEEVAGRWSAPFSTLNLTLWRYADLLPIDAPDPQITLHEGFTPLYRLPQYEALYKHEGIYIKDERYMPTNSFKDRQAALSVTAMKQAGVKEAVLASTGNAGVAYAAYTARAGIKFWLFLTSLVPPEKMREIALYGAEVVKVSGTYDETKVVAATFADRKGVVMDKGAKTIPAKESMKTLAYEIAEQLGIERHPDKPGKFIAPDWYVQAVSGGIGPIGAWKGFEELHKMGLIDKMPRLAIVQSAGCAPMVAAFEADIETAAPVVPKTLIHVLATGEPGFAYTLLYRAVKSNGGVMLSVEDGEAFSAMRRLAATAGISVEPATAVAFAGLDKLFTRKLIKPGETVVINATGHTLPAESHILGDQYDRYILEIEMANSNHSEGLGAAIKNLDEQVTTIVVVDDNPNDRRLIRRLLKSYKQYRVYEATDGQHALQVIQDRQPDLIICDLTMPNMDGFALMEKLKTQPETATIPIIVITAKTLTTNDHRLLEKRTESIWQKGGYDTNNLVEHVISTLGHTTPLGLLHKENAQPLDDASGQKSQTLTDTTPDADHVIVMIDDNPLDLRLARRMLKSMNVDIIEASNGRDGLKAIYNYHPDLIVLDLMLPDLDGFSILDTLEKEVALRDIPVVVVSAKELSPDEKTTLRARIVSRIEKASLDRKSFLNIIKGELNK